MDEFVELHCSKLTRTAQPKNNVARITVKTDQLTLTLITILETVQPTITPTSITHKYEEI